MNSPLPSYMKSDFQSPTAATLKAGMKRCNGVGSARARLMYIMKMTLKASVKEPLIDKSVKTYIIFKEYEIFAQ